MKFFTVTILGFIFTSASALAAVECNSTYRLFDGNGVIKEEVKPLAVAYQAGNTTKMTIDLEQGVYMSATIDSSTKDVLLMLVKAPEYTDGVTGRGSLINGFARLARTDEVKKLVVAEENGKPVAKEIGTRTYTLYKVECYSR